MPNIQYRNYFPSGHYSLATFMLLHQGKTMLEYVIKNFTKYVEGNHILFIHYNGPDDIDENLLPTWVWLNRNPLQTRRYHRSLTIALSETMKYAVEHVDFVNALLLSSGSAFFRRWTVPTKQEVRIDSHELFFNPHKNQFHVSAIPIQYIGNVAHYLRSHGLSAGWQYEFGGDRDIYFHQCIIKRGFQYMKGCQWSGQLFPKEVCEMIAEDIPTLKNHNLGEYACEELYFSTYAYNYAIQHSVQMEECITIINWEFGYEIHHIQQIIDLHEKYKNKKEGYTLCKLPDDVNHPVRRFLLHSPKGLAIA